MKSLIMKIKLSQLLLVFFTVLFSVGVNAQGKEYQGRLWKITGNGLSKPSYLYGTMHVSRKVSFHLSDSFFIGLKNSDIVALESDPSTWMDHFYKRGRKAFTSSWGSQNGGVGFYKNTFSINYPNRYNLKWMFRGENRLTNGMLYRSNSYSEDYEEDTYLDLFIYQAGMKWGKGIASLENNDTVRYLEKLANRPSKEDIKNRKKFKRRYGLYQTIEDAYRDGDLDLLDSLNRLGNPTGHYHHYFIDERNRRMAIKMDSIMQSGKTVFSGVGAAHLPGDVGMIKLFREMGYTVISVTHEEGKIAQKSKEQIEKLKSPVNIKTFTSSDGAFKVDVPGKLYESYYGNTINYYYPDMGNGGYYQVSRVKHYMNLQEKDEAYVMKQLDSLFFENIPGKILTKKQITVDGFSGYDIMNVTKKGEYQRHAIFVSPLEIFYFKAHANGDYLKKESDKFVESIHFFPTQPEKGKTYTFSPPFGEFTVDFPAIPYYSLDTTAIESTNSDFSLQCFDPVNNNYYMFQKASLNDFYFIEEDSFELGRLSEDVMENSKFDSLLTYEQSANPYAQLRVSSANKNGKVIHTFYTTIGGNYYLLLTDANKDLADKYFNSFKKKKHTYKNDYREYVDTNMYFKAKINYYLEPQDEFDDPYSYYRYYGTDEEELDKGYQSKNSYLYFTSPETGEVIAVNYYKYYKYYTAYDTSYWKNIIEYYTDEDNKYPMKLSNLKLDTSGPIKTIEYLVTDTGSSKGIMSKMIVKGGVNYSINTLIDTISGPSEFVSTFFNSFEPLDTTIGLSIFEDKLPIFIHDLFSTDTIEKQHAEQCISRIKFTKDEIDTLIYAYKNLKFEKDPKERKATIIEELGYIKEEKSIPFLEEVYRKSVDTFAYQVAVLESLAAMDKAESFNKLKDLVLEEAPLTDNDYAINNIFYQINDTLELAAKLFPDLLELSTYPEYKSNIYRLLAQLLDSSQIKPNDYAGEVRKITREAKDELKRQFASEGKSQSSYSYSYYSRSKSDDYDAVLDDFAKILAPFYKENESIREFFNRMLRSENKSLKMNTVLTLLDNKVEVNDTFWSFFAHEDKLMADFYESLKERERLELFKNDSVSQQTFARSYIIQNLYSYDKLKDTIVFIDKRLVPMDDTSGYMYFFKVKQENDVDWSFAYSGFFSPDTTDLFAESDVTSTSKELGNKDDIEKLMTDVVKKYRWRERKRISSRNRYSYGEYAIDEYDY